MRPLHHPRPRLRDMPRVLRRIILWLYLIIPQACMLVALGAMLWDAEGRTGLSSTIILGLPAIAASISLLVGGNRRASLRRSVERAEGLVCPDCGFDLSGSPHQGVCPECGVAYDADMVLDAWRKCGVLPSRSP